MDHSMAERNNEKNKDNQIGQVTPKKIFKKIEKKKCDLEKLS